MIIAVKPFTRDTCRQHMGKMIRHRKGPDREEEWPAIKLLGITDDGVFLGELECGPFITYQYLADKCVFAETGEPCGEAL